MAFQGYVEHKKNTDNAWIETRAINYHDEYHHVFNDLEFTAKLDGEFVAKWVQMDSTLPLPKAQMSFLEKVCETRLSFINWHSCSFRLRKNAMLIFRSSKKPHPFLKSRRRKRPCCRTW